MSFARALQSLWVIAFHKTEPLYRTESFTLRGCSNVELLGKRMPGLNSLCPISLKDSQFIGQVTYHGRLLRKQTKMKQ